MAVNFAEALSHKPDEIERPKNPPIGTYTFQIMKIPSFRSNDDYDMIDFSCQAVAASEEVDPADLEAAGGLSAARPRLTFMFDKNDERRFQETEFRLKTFLQDHVKCWDKGMSMKEALNNSVNNRFNGSTRLRPNQDNPDIQYFEIMYTAPAE